MPALSPILGIPWSLPLKKQFGGLSEWDRDYMSEDANEHIIIRGVQMRGAWVTVC